MAVVTRMIRQQSEPSTSAERMALAAAIAAREEARSALDLAEQALARGLRAHGEAADRANPFGDLDGRIEGHRASILAAWASNTGIAPTPDLTLPDDLAEQARTRDEALAVLDAHRAAIEMLQGVREGAEAGVRLCEGKVSRAAEAVILAERDADAKEWLAVRERLDALTAKIIGGTRLWFAVPGATPHAAACTDAILGVVNLRDAERGGNTAFLEASQAAQLTDRYSAYYRALLDDADVTFEPSSTPQAA
jgi:hypothetical protein